MSALLGRPAVSRNLYHGWDGQQGATERQEQVGGRQKFSRGWCRDLRKGCRTLEFHSGPSHLSPVSHAKLSYNLPQVEGSPFGTNAAPAIAMRNDV